jgi:hypothetical protein
MKQARRLETNFTYSNEASTSRASQYRREERRPRTEPSTPSRPSPPPSPMPGPSNATPSNTTRQRVVPGAPPAELAISKKGKGKAKFQGNLTPSTPATPLEGSSKEGQKLDTETVGYGEKGNSNDSLISFLYFFTGNMPSLCGKFQTAYKAHRTR